MHHSFLTTPEWLTFQQKLGRSAWRYDAGGVVANIVRHDIPFGKNYLYIPHGPILDTEAAPGGYDRAIRACIDEVVSIAKREQSIFIKCEPLHDTVKQMLIRAGFTHSTKALQPTRSLLLDLSQSEEELLSGMHHKTRYNIRLGERKGLRLEQSMDGTAFWRLMQQTAKHDGFSPHPASYYQALIDSFAGAGVLQTQLFLVRYEGTVVAGAIILTHGDTMYYLHGAMDRAHKTLKAPSFMRWEIIRYYQSKGIHWYNFWGIDDDRWPGVTRFKTGFGGREVEYPGACDMTISRGWHAVYRIAHSLRFS
ncbi:MAG: peptidoglycan bridge formation glycyltransferase FemA/FemB family protein [Patescibacteria group bacterium]